MRGDDSKQKMSSGTPRSGVFLLPKENGFTLIELIITLTVVGILTAIAVPAFRQFVESSRLTTATNDFIGDLSLARVEAMKRGTGSQTVVCASSNGTSCTGSAWQAGWIIFVDADVSGNFNTGDTSLKIHEALPASLTATTSPTTSTLTFNGMGSMVTSLTYLQFTSANINQQRVICLSGGTGRAMVAAHNSTAACGP